MSDTSILIIDDEVEIVEILCEEIEDLGFQVQGCSSVSEAHNHINAKQFDIIICDYFLGDGCAKDVLDFCQVNNFSGKFILLSGQFDPAQLNALEASIDHFLQKPVSFNQIEELLTELSHS